MTYRVGYIDQFALSVITVASEKYSCRVSCKWQVLGLKKEDRSLTGNSRE